MEKIVYCILFTVEESTSDLRTTNRNRNEAEIDSSIVRKIVSILPDCKIIDI